MTKPDSTQATETLHEIESIFDRMARAVAENPVVALSVAGAILVSAAAVGGYQAWRGSREAAASAEVAAIQSDYYRAMGAKPSQIEIVEPANAEAAAATRREYAQRLLDAAERLAGASAALSAQLQAGTLQSELGENEAALATWRAAAESAPADSTLGALAHLRLGAGLEAAGDPSSAAEAYLAGAQVAGFPGRTLALGDAARCFAEAGQNERALEVFNALSEQDVTRLPVHVSARLRELRVRLRITEPGAVAEAP